MPIAPPSRADCEPACVGCFVVDLQVRELKREYQQWLHERDRDRPDYDGHPDRTEEEVRQWALEHHLPYFDDEVHLPDLRIEYELEFRMPVEYKTISIARTVRFRAPSFGRLTSSVVRIAGSLHGIFWKGKSSSRYARFSVITKNSGSAEMWSLTVRGQSFLSRSRHVVHDGKRL